MAQYVSVAVPVPHLGRLTYRVPAGTIVQRGARVRVPFRSRRLLGAVVDVHDGLPPEAVVAGLDASRIREIGAVVDEQPLLPGDVLALATWVADYYICGIGDAVATAVPAMFFSPARDVDFKYSRVVSATAAAHADDFVPRLGPRQRQLVERLLPEPAGVATTQLTEEGFASGIVAALVARGLATVERQRTDRDPFAAAVAIDEAREAAKAEVVLSDEQRDALERLTELARERRFAAALLHGVTGSGKTEVYRRLAREVVALGRRVLLLVPEIALTPAVAATFRHSFGDRVAILHSALSDGERHDQWHRIRRGDVDVVVGTRSAVFAPLDRLGLIIVDEEHDGSYKQETAPRYNGRDVAVVRARDAAALVVVGSATPSLESLQNARSGRYEHLRLTRRVQDRPLASVSIVDMRAEYAARGPDVIVSEALGEALANRLDRGEQAIVLLNRRGFAPSLFCRQCGESFACPNCSVSLTYHKRQHRLRCHYCDFSRQSPSTCEACGGDVLEYMGVGTERVEDALTAMFPRARLARVDRDTVRRRGEIVDVLGRFARREVDILVGTQMLAKGHDFHGVTLVGVISADVGLGMADFRASERTFQLLTQVAGRAGRGDMPGDAYVQTLFPDHAAIVHAVTQDYDAFTEQEMAFRRDMRYPPFVSLIALTTRASTMPDALDLARACAHHIKRHSGDVARLVGPAPAPLQQLRGQFRAQVFVKSGDRAVARRAVRAALDALHDRIREITVDVDPYTVL